VQGDDPALDHVRLVGEHAGKNYGDDDQRGG
jgi:hypothetical protein